jgi:DtxR family Mn-dependent transcriptional regulator
MDYLKSEDLVTLKEGKLYLTDKGDERARKIIRLHRLAERLLNDVLGMVDKKIEESACRFEHFLDDDVEEAICTLLGHPAYCPHGRKIPKGECCLKGEEEVERLIFRLSELSPGDEGEIKYIAGGKEIHNKTIAFGLLPGEKIRVIRVFPVFVIEIGNTQLALDKKFASSIYILKINGERRERKNERHRWRWGWFRDR